MSAEELNAAIAAQPVVVQEIQYVNRWSLVEDAIESAIEADSAYSSDSSDGLVKTPNYPNFFSPTYLNNSGTDIKDLDAVIAMWDKDNLPVKFYWGEEDREYPTEDYPMVYDAGFDQEKLDYVGVYSHKDVNLPAGGTYDYGDDIMYQEATDEERESNVYFLAGLQEFYLGGNTVKAVVLRYTDFEGNEWVNPYIEDWISVFAGKKLVE